MESGQFLLCTKNLYMNDTTETLAFCFNGKYPILEVEEHEIIIRDDIGDAHTITDEVDTGWLPYFKEVES